MWSVRKLWVLDCGLNEIQNGARQGKGIRGLVSDLFATKGTRRQGGQVESAGKSRQRVGGESPLRGNG
ncbi:MAG: hypothetical protein KJ550_02935 [Proteobacteria bacterium]|nr:hypothetical protein [Desulfobacteraceae bacterium]MBU3981793.1 hypothetical protein [Pseudomonadota bacterium]MBU4012401.1 hypothetical protein [Pseudomonadota bacterium]MBU4068487.1 hypothetical protein [Pseudomonadota bacterium]MBU4101539.1 hypothetical protein [Pseudomonadota bacterium]